MNTRERARRAYRQMGEGGLDLAIAVRERFDSDFAKEVHGMFITTDAIGLTAFVEDPFTPTALLEEIATFCGNLARRLFELGQTVRDGDMATFKKHCVAMSRQDFLSVGAS